MFAQKQRVPALLLAQHPPLLRSPTSRWIRRSPLAINLNQFRDLTPPEVSSLASPRDWHNLCFEGARSIVS
jgi:hypothetical protein